MKGSFGSVSFFRGLFVVCNSYIVFSLCMKFLMSVCKACIGRCFGFGINFSPFLRTFFCSVVKVVCLASMTRDPSSSVSIVLSKSRCWSTESLSWLMVCTILCLSVFCICFCLCLYFLYIVLFSSVRLEVRLSLGSLSRLRGLFLGLVVVVVVVLADVVIAVEVRFLYTCL